MISTTPCITLRTHAVGREKFSPLETIAQARKRRGQKKKREERNSGSVSCIVCLTSRVVGDEGGEGRVNGCVGERGTLADSSLSGFICSGTEQAWTQKPKYWQEKKNRQARVINTFPPCMNGCFRGRVHSPGMPTQGWDRKSVREISQRSRSEKREVCSKYEQWWRPL